MEASMQTFYQPLYGYEEFKALQEAIQKKKAACAGGRLY